MKAVWLMVATAVCLSWGAHAEAQDKLTEAFKARTLVGDLMELCSSTSEGDDELCHAYVMAVYDAQLVMTNSGVKIEKVCGGLDHDQLMLQLRAMVLQNAALKMVPAPLLLMAVASEVHPCKKGKRKRKKRS